MSIAGDSVELQAPAPEMAFSEAVSRLATQLGAQRPIGTSGPVEGERILFRATPSLGFPASDISAITASGAAAAWSAEMDVTFLGLYGPSSPLPPSWTERIVMEETGADNLRDLLDLFNHPLIALAYRIWRHYRLDLRFTPDARDSGSRAMLALAGVPTDKITADLDPVRLLPVCGLLARHARSAEVVRRVVSAYFDVPAAIEEWVPRMAPIPPDQQFRLGAPWLALGRTIVLGEAVPDVAGAVTVLLGPLSEAQFKEFLPGGAARASLRALLGLVVREPIECRIDLLLAPDAPGGLVLGQGHLGWTTWQAAPGAIRRCPTGPA